MADKGYHAEKRALREKGAGKVISGLTMATVLPENTSVVGLPASTVETGNSSRPASDGSNEDGAQLVRKNKRKASDPGPNLQVDKKLKHQWEFKFASDYSITESPNSVAMLMRHFKRPGFKIPMFNQLTIVNRENYFRFAGCVGQLLAEYNRAVDSYEEQLRSSPVVAELKESKDLNNELTLQVRKMQVIIEENGKAAERAQGSVSRLRKLESKIREVEQDRDAIQKKLQISEDVVTKLKERNIVDSGLLKESEVKCQALIRIRHKDVLTSMREAKKEIVSKCDEISQKIKSHLEGRDAFQKSMIRVAETNANFELLSELVKGVIVDPQAELDEVTRDKEEAAKELAKITIPELDLALFESSKFFDSSSMADLTTDSQTPIKKLDEFGSNVDLMTGFLNEENQDIAKNA